MTISFYFGIPFLLIPEVLTFFYHSQRLIIITIIAFCNSRSFVLYFTRHVLCHFTLRSFNQCPSKSIQFLQIYHSHITSFLSLLVATSRWQPQRLRMGHQPVGKCCAQPNPTPVPVPFISSNNRKDFRHPARNICTNFRANGQAISINLFTISLPLLYLAHISRTHFCRI